MLHPERLLGEARFPPYTLSSALLARKLERGLLESYVEPLSINGHALLHAERANGRVRVTVAVRIEPMIGGTGVEEEWRLTWQRWSRMVEWVERSGARARSVGLEGRWAGLRFEAPAFDVGSIAAFIGAARGIAGLTPYTGRADPVNDIDYFHHNERAVERIHETLTGYTLLLLTGLETGYGKPDDLFRLAAFLVDNALYLTLEEPLWVWEPGLEPGRCEPRSDYASTVNKVSELLRDLYGAEQRDPDSSPSRPVIAEAVKALERLGAVRWCTVETMDRDCVRRRRRALFFDLRHELVLSDILPTPSYLESEEAGAEVDLACTLLPYITGVRHLHWEHYPGGLSVCERTCSNPNTACNTARRMEAGGWPEKPLKPGPCHGTRPVVLI